MNAKQLLRTLQGKTIKDVSVGKEEASDSCAYAQMVLTFTDGSEFQFQFHALPQVAGIFFKDHKDAPNTETVLVVWKVV